MDELDCEDRGEAALNLDRANAIVERLKDLQPLAMRLKLRAGMLQYRKVIQ
jgi:hypothetical protein